ncbi:phosphatidate cytidylyltransferase [Flavobacterium sp. I3-2]|uniref:phosphatidate cytidylyltransferase n=1 Tax=Flavobacterium sp. I3-2 TaxID=2748319 RepID=UPI0015ADAB30|nr:phosphatidate cytidylyltransferase [Flavobacterium sp. I3-2]
MSETLTRSISGIVYIVLLIGATLFSYWTFNTLMLFFLFVGTYEFSKIYKINLVGSFLTALFFSIPLLTNSSVFEKIIPYSLLFEIPFLAFLIFDLFRGEFKIYKSTLVKYLFLIGYVILPFIILTQLPLIKNQFEPKIVIGMFILIWNNDTFAYICGKSFGKRKLFEKMSPKKTIEGFLGGLFFTLIASYILSIYFTFFDLETWLLTAILVSSLGTIGDLVESKFKRQANIKDSGSIMPGHGGILDRLDSVIFATPFLFLIYLIL